MAGFPVADAVVGLLITIVIFGVVWQSSKAVLTTMLDGIGSTVLDEIRHAATHVPGIAAVLDVRARWLGHRLTAAVRVRTRAKSGQRPSAGRGDAHRHAAEPVAIRAKLARGTIEIADTAVGERVRFMVESGLENLRAEVKIVRTAGQSRFSGFPRRRASLVFFGALRHHRSHMSSKSS